MEDKKYRKNDLFLPSYFEISLISVYFPDLNFFSGGKMQFFIKNMLAKNKYRIATTISLAAIVIAGCQSKKEKNNTEVLGTFNSKSIKYSDLSVAERNELINAQKKVYETAQAILEKHYLDAWFEEYKEKNKLASVDAARQDFYSKKASVSDSTVENFLTENANNPQLKQIPEKERAGLVKQYLSRMEQAKAEQDIILDAQEKGKISLTGIEKPQDIVVTFNDSGYKYHPKLTNPKVTIVEFADYQCPYCVRAHETLEKVLADYKDNVQFVYKDFPLMQIHPQALPAAVAAKCAEKQNKYWDMHKALYAKGTIEKLSNDTYVKIATDLKLNIPEFKACIEDKDKTISKTVMLQMEEANNIGINATPSIFINGEKYEGNLSVSALKKEIDEKLKGK